MAVQRSSRIAASPRNKLRSTSAEAVKRATQEHGGKSPDASGGLQEAGGQSSNNFLKYTGETLRDTLQAVRIVRIWLLVLIAVLLPIQGAVAAVMLCPNESTPMHQHESMAPGHQAMSHDDGMHSAHRHAGAVGHHDHGGAGHADKCNLCASCCAGTAISTTFETVFAPLEAATGSFAAPASPAASFLSDGQDRPPRSI